MLCSHTPLFVFIAALASSQAATRPGDPLGPAIADIPDMPEIPDLDFGEPQSSPEGEDREEPDLEDIEATPQSFGETLPTFSDATDLSSESLGPDQLNEEFPTIDESPSASADHSITSTDAQEESYDDMARDETDDSFTDNPPTDEEAMIASAVDEPDSDHVETDQIPEQEFETPVVDPGSAESSSEEPPHTTSYDGVSEGSEGLTADAEPVSPRKPDTADTNDLQAAEAIDDTSDDISSEEEDDTSGQENDAAEDDLEDDDRAPNEELDVLSDDDIDDTEEPSYEANTDEDSSAEVDSDAGESEEGDVESTSSDGAAADDADQGAAEEDSDAPADVNGGEEDTAEKQPHMPADELLDHCPAVSFEGHPYSKISSISDGGFMIPREQGEGQSFDKIECAGAESRHEPDARYPEVSALCRKPGSEGAFDTWVSLKCFNKEAANTVARKWNTYSDARITAECTTVDFGDHTEEIGELNNDKREIEFAEPSSPALRCHSATSHPTDAGALPVTCDGANIKIQCSSNNAAAFLAAEWDAPVSHPRPSSPPDVAQEEFGQDAASPRREIDVKPHDDSQMVYRGWPAPTPKAPSKAINIGPDAEQERCSQASVLGAGIVEVKEIHKGSITVELPDTTYLQRTGPQLVTYECTGFTLPPRGLAARYTVRQQCRDPASPPASTEDGYNIRVSLICEGEVEVEEAAHVWGDPAPLNNTSIALPTGDVAKDMVVEVVDHNTGHKQYKQLVLNPSETEKGQLKELKLNLRALKRGDKSISSVDAENDEVVIHTAGRQAGRQRYSIH
ncbi:hypothetical protein FOZ60_013176 [Perkinsus olseni]|uniref:Uncharacterized protein n=1 Tax=Perkinsus olseni TaxID=32597 RepID=A0A7J6P9G0_PEROL|nr:hypothetical protein FOZ60_013176 [Perkinsus olseni]